MTEDNAYSGSHPLLDMQVINWKSWRCLGAYFRTTEQPQRLDTASAHRAYRIPRCLLKLAARCIWNRKFHIAIVGKCTIHTYLWLRLSINDSQSLHAALLISCHFSRLRRLFQQSRMHCGWIYRLRECNGRKSHTVSRLSKCQGYRSFTYSTVISLLQNQTAKQTA